MLVNFWRKNMLINRKIVEIKLLYNLDGREKERERERESYWIWMLIPVERVRRRRWRSREVRNLSK